MRKIGVEMECSVLRGIVLGLSVASMMISIILVFRGLV